MLVVAAAACTDGDAAVTRSADIAEHPTNAISAVLEVEADPAAAVSVRVDGPGGGFDIPAAAAATSHRIPVVGMRADSHYVLTVASGEAEVLVEWDTGSLPDDLPSVSASVADTARMQPGVTVFTATRWDPVPEGEPPPDAGYVIAVDGEGEVIWYTRITNALLDLDITPRGTFLATAAESVIEEIDLFGDVVREWATRVATEIAVTDLQGRVLASDDAIAVGFDSAHHEVTELANGNLITLSTELLELSDADASSLCPDNPEPRLIGDVVVEMAPDGSVVHEWPLSAVFPPAEHPGAEMCVDGPVLAPPNWFYAKDGGIRDWTHANAIQVHEPTNALIVSPRHFDGIVALRYAEDEDGPAGELLWSFGVDGTLDLDGEPPYHQHAMELDDDGTLLLYDNGNLRPGTIVGGGDAPPYSRAVQYRLDLDAGTVTQEWEHRDTWSDGRPIFTPFLGDVDRHANGNVLITHGGGSSADGGYLAKIVEVIPGEAPDGSADEIVFDLEVGAGEARPDGAPTGWTVYRAERLASLYFGS